MDRIAELSHVNIPPKLTSYFNQSINYASPASSSGHNLLLQQTAITFYLTYSNMTTPLDLFQ